jgi:K+/H+ antiporter YhaU regulatory subunit KhtT
LPVLRLNPDPDAVVGAGDKLVVLGRPESLTRLETEAGSTEGHVGTVA